MDNPKLNDIKEEAKKFFEKSNGCHDFHHTERVYNLCMHIGKKENANLEILGIAALLHDIGREEETKTKGEICHAEHGSKIARKILEKKNFNKDDIDKIIHCILCHRFRKNRVPESKEAKVLFDADKLDSIGAIGVGRAFLFAGEAGARLHDENVDVDKTEAYSKEDTPYREFLIKLSKIKDRLFTEEGKKIAEERHEYMEDFFKRINREIKGEI